MIERKLLLSDLKKQVGAVEADLASQVVNLPGIAQRLKVEHEIAVRLNRTAANFSSWLAERITQAGVAWVLGTVFVRFCEDNGLIPQPYLTAPGQDRHDVAQAGYENFVESDDNPTYRGWLEKAFAELGQGQAGKLLFNRDHNPLYQIPISHDAARLLADFWRRRDEDGRLIHDFTDPLGEDGTSGWDTRFLGDLYQDLSESARKTHALLQTPEFLEEFILDRTMRPALEEFGYENLKMIDPTCGSGHFILGAFRRLVRLWAENPRGKDLYARVYAALESVHGVDINPFAVAIARFRLLVAVMAAADIRTLAEAAKFEWPIRIAVGDSLIKERQLEVTLVGEAEDESIASHSYATEDIHEFPRILEKGRYHVVVGNPPYITVKDKKLNEIYRGLYPACAGTYAMSVPFAQRFFELAKRGRPDGSGYGMVGQITANSFMKREFGTKLIERFFADEVELTEVIDTSGAYIPGHGTPTVILVGRPQSGKNRGKTIRTVRSVQGEPSLPASPEAGVVWSSIVRHIDSPGYADSWVSVDDLDRTRYFGRQPWILADGGLEMVEQINKLGSLMAHTVALPIGRAIRAGADEAYIRPLRESYIAKFAGQSLRPLVVGEAVRDWRCSPEESIWFPYSGDAVAGLKDELWFLRRILQARRTFQGDMEKAGLSWWDYMQYTDSAYETPMSISFAFVATHNHFVLDRGGKVFKQSAPVIKLSERAGEEEHLGLLGLLNSSMACFWLKQVSHNKGSTVDSLGARQSTVPFEDFYEFTGTKLQEFPVPSARPLGIAAALDRLAQDFSALISCLLTSARCWNTVSLDDERARWKSVRARMIALQEELDWQVYSLYKLFPEDLRAAEDDVPELALGERAFEIVLARRVEAGEASDEWFRRHGSTPITEIPERWPEGYRRVVQKRIDAIESSRAIGMIERPEYKRRWATEGWDSLQDKALRGWLLDRMEGREYWFEDGLPVIRTLSQLADMLSRDDEFVSVALIFAPREELRGVVGKLVSGEHVPFLAALRYKASGLKKRADWEHVWDLQRREDAAADEIAKRRIRDATPVPPKYAPADFLRPSFWRARGKLDVPKERFISYGETNVATPNLYGWAGWDHKEQAQALAAHIAEQDLSSEEIRPYLAGLLELQPWIQQWHDEFDDLYGGSPAAFFAGYRVQTQGEHGLTDDDLRAWRPPAARGRRAKR
ncbi:BREX-2 system adenine-specific DNA-methyltransferase PglX [Actinomadura rayongensis]|uniref:site-specific DNA-methyltransferase (adenine-specific) n=1 Tax=Actinomadura rayongensis TaxID=1429076 RepID=A0A6I4W6F3_9ACTN|nr:BREX-2 system adenine-specific DNA-methyltransferase PglX [Actinomadura rayongensis]MXQ65081.1 BREX-2 system adenine-specific DNA-methyltransferase PglX [Actinomadura rayongensis]